MEGQRGELRKKKFSGRSAAVDARIRKLWRASPTRRYSPVLPFAGNYGSSLSHFVYIEVPAGGAPSNGTDWIVGRGATRRLRCRRKFRAASFHFPIAS